MQKRHPKVCSFYRDFGRCKFNPCAYRHVNYLDNDRLQQLEKAIEERDIIINEMKTLITFNTEKINTLEHKMLEIKNSTVQSVIHKKKPIIIKRKHTSSFSMTYFVSILGPLVIPEIWQ